MRHVAFLALIVALLAPGLLFAGGQEEAAGAGAETEESAAEPVELSVLWFNDANESEVFQEAMSDYLEANPNVTLNVQVVPFQDYENKLKLMIAGGDPPDIARVTNNHIAMLYQSMLPLEGNMEGIEELKSSFYDSSLSLATFNGSTVALPTEATANGMLVNKTYFENVGIDIDELSKTWTWEEYVDAMEQAIEGNEQAQFGIAYDYSPHRWSTLLYAAGGRFLNEDETAMNFNTPEAVDTLNFFKRLHDEGLAPKSVWMGSEKPQELFMSGLAVTHIGGSWWINAYASDIENFEWGAVHMPKREMSSSVPGGKFVATFEESANTEAALDVMRAFSQQGPNAHYSANTYNISARTDNADIDYPSRSEDFTVMATDLANTPAYAAEDWKSPELNKIYSYIREQIVEMLIGNQTPEETAQRIHDRGNEFFE